MWETITEAISAVREGTLSPFTALLVGVFGVFIWLAAKVGDAMIKAVSNLLGEGKTLRAALNEELAKAHDRSRQMQAERDDAMRQLGEAQVALARMQEQRDAANANSNRLASDLIDAHRQLQDARVQTVKG